MIKYNFQTVRPLILIAAALLSSHALSGDHQNLEQRVAALQAKDDAWYDSLIFSGVIEVEASYTNPDSGNSESDLVIATAELGAEAELHDNLSAALVLLYEENDTDLEVDIATISYKHTANGFSFVLGQDYVPFGSYSTALVNDPLTLEMGEARETAFVAHYENGQFNGAFYLFNGDQIKDGREELNNYGARIAFAGDSFSVGVDYLSNLADSDGLQEKDYGYNSGENVVAGSSLYGEISLGSVHLLLEHLRALDEFVGDGNDSKPTASQFEVSFETGDFTYAVSYQNTDEALFLSLPEQRISVGLSTEILGGLGLGLELNVDEDYSVTDGGTGNYTNSVVLQLAAEF